MGTLRKQHLEPTKKAVAISLDGVSKLYCGERKPALHHINLVIEDGEFVFLTGESGSGKTTLLKLCLLEECVDTGTLTMFKHDVTRLAQHKRPLLRQQIGTIFQDYKLLKERTVYENVAFALEATGRKNGVIKARTHEALELVGLLEKMHSFPRHLSGGEQQRVSIARAVACRPRLILADEPTGNLDPASSEIVYGLLQTLNETGMTVVVATHDQHAVNRINGRVLTLQNGILTHDRYGGYKVTS